MQPESPTPIVVGRVVKPHGIRGELVVDIRTDSPRQRFVPGAVFGLLYGRETRSSGSLELVAVREHAGRLLLTAEGVRSRDDAEALRGALLTVRADEVPGSEDPEEFHDQQLEGLRVELRDATTIGTVSGVLHTPAGELVRVRRDDGSETLVPFVAEIVPEVDLENARLIVDPPEGLLDV